MVSRASHARTTISAIGNVSAQEATAHVGFPEFEELEVEPVNEETRFRSWKVSTAHVVFPEFEEQEVESRFPPVNAETRFPSWKVSSTVFLGIGMLQGGPFVFVPMRATCTVDSDEVAFKLTIVSLLPLYLVTWAVGHSVCQLISEWRRDRQISRMRFWTVWFLIATFTGCLLGALQVVWRCGVGTDGEDWVFTWWLSDVCLFSSWSLVAFLSALKLRLMMQVTPVNTRVGSFLAMIAIVCNGACICLTAAITFRMPLNKFALKTALSLNCFCIVALCVCVLLALEFSRRANLEEASCSDLTCEIAEELAQAARWLRKAQALVALSAATTAVFSCQFVVFSFLTEQSNPFIKRLLNSCCVAAEIFCNTQACMVLSTKSENGGMSSSSSIALSKGVTSLVARRYRQIELRLTNHVGKSTGSALSVGKLMGCVCTDVLLANAIARFRCIRWEALAQRPDIIIGGAPLDVLGAGGNDLIALSEPCQLGCCDAFVSHSWSDSGILKWQALKCWCEKFKADHGRFPRLWIDKLCLDQSNIDADLQCLPVFLAGCNTMLALSGSTYHKRMWCLVEFLIYRAMLVSDCDRSYPVVWMLGETLSECEENRQGWLKFSVRDCECFKSEDKQRIMKVFEAYPGGTQRFDRFIQEVGADLLTVFVRESDFDEQI